MSLTLVDSPADSRRCLTFRRRSLYIDEDNVLPAHRFCPTEETNSGTTSIQYTTYSDFWKMKVLKTKSRQTLVVDPGGSTGRLRACPFLGACRALLCGEVFVWAPDGTRGWSIFWQKDGLKYRFPKKRTSDSYVLRLIVVPPEARLIWGAVKVRQQAI